ncbi:hypothetical protein DINM_022676 [Dirofilaria immitis]|nr:hypothetical protein [Dirofilaria immitis]
MISKAAGGPLVRHSPEAKWYDYGDLELQSKKNTIETAWLSTVLIRGTASDKVTAMQIMTQRDPVHSLAYVASLVNIVAKKNTREAFSVLSLLKDLFINELLPPKRKLITFAARPVDKINLLSLDKDFDLKRKLILWKFESDLKAIYEKFVAAIERLAGENIEKLGILSCRCAMELLISRAEQEQLTRKQPLMRLIVVKEVERLIYRKLEYFMLYTASCNLILSQMNLHGCDPTLASTLLNIYVGLFRIDSAANLSDVHDVKGSQSDVDKLMKEIDILYKILHQSNFSTAVQTLKLLYQLLTTSEGISDRFYSALYRRILNLQHGTNVDRQLFSLLYRALSSDTAEYRVAAFIKRLLQLSLCRNAPFAAATLILISRLIENRPSLLITKKAANVNNWLAKFNKETEFVGGNEEVYYDYDSFIETINTEVSITSTFESSEEVANDVKPCEKQAFGWMHKNNIVVRNNALVYDPMVRNPLFARADKSIAAELTLLSMHYHPSVAVFASNLLKGISVRYDGDPLLDFTQIRFLDRFVFRNPKTNDMNEKNMRCKVYDSHSVRKLPVMSKEYAAKSRNEIPTDERFLHRFASMKMRMKKENENEVIHEDDDIESVNSDEFNMLLKEEKEKEMEGRKQSLENDADDIRKRDVMDVDEDEEFEDWSEDDIEVQIISSLRNEVDFKGRIRYCGRKNGESSESEFAEETQEKYDSDDSDDFVKQFSYVEDAAISADKFTTMLEEENESERKESKRKTKKVCGFKKRRSQ